MSERPFMQFYPSDFVGDTMHLTTEQIGAYFLILLAMWNNGGTLPNDERKLARIARASVKKWRGMCSEIMDYFEDKEGILSQSRMTKEVQKVRRKSDLRRSAGAKGGAAKALKDKEAGLAKASLLPWQLPEPEPEPYKTTKKDTPPNGGNSSKYFFEEGVIRLTEADFRKWEASFPELSLAAELLSLAEWTSRPEQRDKWFFAVASALAKRNREARVERLAREKREARPRDHGAI